MAQVKRKKIPGYTQEETIAIDDAQAAKRVEKQYRKEEMGETLKHVSKPRKKTNRNLRFWER